MAVLHVKSPNGTSYNMTIVTSGTTESINITAGCGWHRLPNGLLIQYGIADLRDTGPGDSRWRVPLQISFTEPLFAMACGRAGLPQGVVNVYDLREDYIAIIASTITWDWLPQEWSFGVSYLAFGE